MSTPTLHDDVPIIRMRDVAKQFGSVFALKGVDLELRAGQVHALLGENGAGKSTLMNILSGMLEPDAGTIELDGRPVRFTSPAHADEAGIGMVHQQFRLVADLTVAQNLYLGWNKTPFGVSPRKLAAWAAAAADRFAIDIDPDAFVWQLAVGEQQRVAILRTLMRGTRVVVFDEPTAVLTPNETRGLFSTMRRLAAEGNAIVFISHKLPEVLEVSDVVTVLRHGNVVAHNPIDRWNARSLARSMVGSDVVLQVEREEVVLGEIVLEAQGVTVLDDRRQQAVHDLDLAVHGGEIVGIAGISGNGQREFAEAIAGMRPLAAGRVLVAGAPVQATARKLADLGIGHIPEDRDGVGLARHETISINSVLKRYWRAPISRGGIVSRSAIARFASSLVATARLSTSETSVRISQLSGGNRQKLLTRRELDAGRLAVIASHPTAGVDIGATKAIWEALLAARAEGRGILLLSEDLEEIFALSDRIAVMYEGRITAQFARADADPETVGLYMGGSAAQIAEATK